MKVSVWGKTTHPKKHSNDYIELGVSAEQSGRQPSAIPFMEHADGMGTVML